MPHNSLSNTPLKKQRPLFHFGMHFTIDKNSRIEVFLREIAQVFVFGHDAFVDFADEREICRGRVFVAEDLVLHGGGGGAAGDETLDHEEVGSGFCCWLMML